MKFLNKKFSGGSEDGFLKKFLFGRQVSQAERDKVNGEIFKMTPEQQAAEADRQEREAALLAKYEEKKSPEEKQKLDDLADKSWKNFGKIKKIMDQSDNAPKN